jgi:hypothetical protein
MDFQLPCIEFWDPSKELEDWLNWSPCPGFLTLRRVERPDHLSSLNFKEGVEFQNWMLNEKLCWV